MSVNLDWLLHLPEEVSILLESCFSGLLFEDFGEVLLVRVGGDWSLVGVLDFWIF